MKTTIFILICCFFGCLLASCEQKHVQIGGLIALTPSLTEAVWAVGTPENMPLVATSTYTTDARAEGLLRLQADGALEQIVAINPSLVLLHPSDSRLASRLKAANIPVMTRAMDTIEDVENTLNELGQILGREQAAAQAVQKLHREIIQMPQHSGEKKPKLLLIIDRLDMRMQQFYLAQPPAFIADLVEGCGYEVMRVKTDTWAHLDAETLIKIQPDHILFLARSPKDAEQVKSEFKRVFFSSLQAVQSGQFYVYDNPDITIPGPEMGRRQQMLCDFLDSLPHSPAKNELMN